MCGLCTNADRKQKIRQGLLVVLTIDMSKVRQTTLMRIKALIQADMER